MESKNKSTFRVFGIRLGTMLFAFIIIFGQIIFSMGGFLDRLWVMEVGRFVFGIGGESLSVAQNTYAVSWFKGKELNMVFGFQVKIIFEGLVGGNVRTKIYFIFVALNFDLCQRFGIKGSLIDVYSLVEYCSGWLHSEFSCHGSSLPIHQEPDLREGRSHEPQYEPVLGGKPLRRKLSEWVPGARSNR